MDKYIRESVRRNQKKRRDACCIALGYVLRSLSCMALVVLFGG